MGIPEGAIPAKMVEYWARLGYLDRVRAAIAEGYDVNEIGVGGYTALHAAAENGHVEAVKLLLQFGANPNARLDTGETPLDSAKAMKMDTVVALLEALPRA